jgi:hypothetical protein
VEDISPQSNLINSGSEPVGTLTDDKRKNDYLGFFAMTSLTASLLRVLPAVLLCLTLTGAADAAESSGAVVGWGDDFYGQATPPDTVTGPVTDISASVAANSQSCAIQAGTGNVVCWGNSYYGQATPPNAVNGVSGTAADISAGTYHAHESTLLRAEIGDFAVGRQVEAVNPASVLGHERVVGNPRHRLTAPFQRT